MQSVKIEKGVPLPPERKRKYDFPFADMDVGASFVVKDVPPHTVSVLAYRAGKKLERTFCTKKEDDGVRVWRRA